MDKIHKKNNRRFVLIYINYTTDTTQTALEYDIDTSKVRPKCYE